MPKHPKAWVLTTSQDFGPNGSLQLGQLLTKPWDPNSAVISRNLAPIPLDALRDNQAHNDVDFSSMRNEQVSFRTWLRTRSELIPAEGDVGAAQANAAWARYQSSTVMVHMFPPDDAYAEEAVQAGRAERRTQVAWWARTKTLWLVTGLRILADGTSVDLWSAEFAGHHIRVAVDGTPVNVPVEGGVLAQDQHVAAQAQRMGGASSFVYAYRIHEVTKRPAPDTASVQPWAKGEVYSSGPKDEDGGGSDLKLLDVRASEMGDEKKIDQGVPMSAHGIGENLPSGDGTQEEYYEFVKVKRTPFQGDGSENDALLIE